MKRTIFVLAGAVATWSCIQTAVAQVPSGVLPGQIERSQNAPREPQFPIEVPASAGADQPIPANAPDIRLRLNALQIEGATVYGPGELERAYAGLIGTDISLRRVYEIAAELTARYRNDGYVLSQVLVPAQSVRDGKVTLRVVEGYVSQVQVQASAEVAALLGAYAEAIKASRPLRAADLERTLLLVNDLPGLVVQSTLAPSATPGAADLTLVASQTRVSTTLASDNRNSELLGPWRANLDVDVNGLGGADRLGLKGVSTLGSSELGMVTLVYDRLLGSDGLKLSLNATALKSRPQPTSALPDLASTAQSGGLSLSYPLIRSRLQNFKVHAGYSQHDGDTDSNGAALFRDRVRALRLGAGWDGVDGLRGINLIELEASQGLTGGATERGDPLASRAGAPPDFQKFTYYVARLQSLAPKWSLLLAASGQSSNSSLLSAEQFSFGGSEFGRGYNASDLSGDSGNAAKLELRFSDAGSGWLRDYTLYLFADAGQVQRSGTSAGDDRASSGGLGLRFNGSAGLSGFAEYAKPLDHDIPASANRDARLSVGVSYAF